MKLVAWLASMLSQFDPPPIAPVPGKPPVILVHGIHSRAEDMTRLARSLRAGGREVFIPTLRPSNGSIRLEELAGQLAEFAEREVPGRKFDLIGFSMGGLVSRYYLQRLGGVDRISHFITLATPHHGTICASLSRLPGCMQMQPESEFLRDIARDADVLRRVKFTSFYTPLDAVIIPQRSSEMPQARNIRIWAALHPSWIMERRCIRAVSAVLE